MADPLSLAVLSASITGLLMRGAAVAVDPSWSSAASLPGEALNAWRSLRRLQQGRGGQENPLEASIKSRLQKQVEDASERYELAGVSRSALAGAVTEMEVALKELSRDDDAVVEAVRFPDNFETYLRRRTAGHRRNVDAAAEPFFDDLTRIVAEEFIHLAPGSRGFDIATLKQLLAGQEQLLAGQEQLLEGQAETHELLGTMATDIKEIHSAIPQSQPASPTRIRFGSRPMVTAGFVEREGQDELFDAILTRAEPRAVLTGMRGSGKTQLAAAVAAKCEEEGWSIVAWINAASREELVADLYELALQAGIDAPKEVPPETIIRRSLDQLRSADAADCLFVFDNVENLDDLKGITPEGSGIRVIITTTRHLDWDSLGWLPLTVGVFDREQSITLLCGRTGDAHRDAADRIADALGDLPVAVTQAAATAKWGGYALSDYLGRLSNHPLESSISRLEGDDYPDAVGVALFMAYEQALEQIRSKHPQQERIAISLLDALSLLAASGVPTHWLLGLDDDSDTVRDTLSFLKRSSILQESIDGNKTIIHRLQGQVYRENYLSDHTKVTEASTHVTTLLNRINIEQLNNFQQQRQETQNIAEQLRSITPKDYFHLFSSDSTFISSLATTLQNAVNLGMPQLALTLADTVFQVFESVGFNQPDILITRNNLAYAYQTVGRLDEAITLHQQNLKVLTDILGPDAPYTFPFRNNLANTYQAAGRLDEAIKLRQQNLKDSEDLLGPDHPRTLTLRNNLACTYHDAGRLDEAIRLLKQVLEDSTRILGPNHPDTLQARNNLANTYQAAGRLDEAIRLLKQVLEDSTRILGPNHPLTLTSRNNLAYTYQDKGRLDEAIPLLEQTLKDSTHILGPNHPLTLTTQDNLAIAYRTAGRLDEAIPLLEQNLTGRSRTLVPNHPDTLTSRHNLASAYQAAGRLDEAIPLYQQNLEASTRILGPHHPNTLTSRNNLANAYHDAGRLDEAIPLYEQTLTDSTRILGPHHPHTLTTRNNLASAYRAADRIEEAKALLETPSGSEDEQDGTEEDLDQETGD